MQAFNIIITEISSVILDIKHEQIGVKNFPKSINLVQVTHNLGKYTYLIC